MNMNKKSIITMMLALVAMTGLAQTKTATVTGYSPALKDGTLVLRVAATSLPRHRASPCLAGPRLFSLRHAQLPEHHPQGYHVRSE